MLSLAMKKGRTHDSSNIFNITEDAHTRTQQHTRTQCGCEGGGGGRGVWWKEGVVVVVVVEGWGFAIAPYVAGAFAQYIFRCPPPLVLY